MTTYRIDPRNNANKVVLTVEAENYSTAAKAAAKKYFGPIAMADRVTGEGTKSGMFQAYVKIGGGQAQLSSVGSGFHVMEL